MFLRSIYTCFALFMLLGSRAQDKLALDTLSLQVRTSNIAVKVKALNELCRIFTGIDNNKAMDLAYQALALSQKKGDRSLIAQSHNRLGTIFDYRSMTDSAQRHYLRALSLFEQLDDKSGIASVYQNIGVMYYYQDNLDKAIEWYQKAIALRKQTNELDYVAKLQNNMAVVLRRQEKFAGAIDYYKQSLAIKLKFKDSEAIATGYTNLATAFLYTQQYDSARMYLQRSIDINTGINSSINLAGNYFTLAQIFVDEKKYAPAYFHLNQSIELATKAESNDILYNCYDLMWQIDTLTNRYKQAVRHQFLAATYKARVFKADQSKAVERMNVIYETEKKDREIAELNAEQETKNAQNRLLLISLLLSGLIILVSGFYFLQLRRKNRLLARQKKEVEEKTEQLKKQAAEIARFRTQMNPHFMFNALVSVQRSILTEDKNKASESLTQLSKLMRLTLENSEKEMITLGEEKKFLDLYLGFEQARFENGFDVEFKISHGLDLENTLLPVMIVQPFLENAIKHGMPATGRGKIEISLDKAFSADRKEEFLVLAIKDNGKGIQNVTGQQNNAAQHVSKGTGITFQRIQNTWQDHGGFKENYIRVKDIGQELKQAQGTGTVIIIALPFIENF